MADHSKPTLTSNYTNFVSEIDGRFDDLSKGLDPATTSATNIPVDSIRWSSASNRWEKWNGTSWAILTTGIAMNAEWSASTVSQTEAEAGTATTRRAWTAQRVRQAIAAWWESAKSALTGPVNISANSTVAALKVTQTGTGNAFVVEDQAGDTTPFVIDANGVVVSGYHTPISVPWDGGLTQFRMSLVGGGASAGLAIVSSIAGVDGNGPTISMARSLGTVDSPTAIAENDYVMAVIGSGHDGSGYQRAAQIHAAIDGTPSANSMPGRLVFSTTPSGSSAVVEAMRIDSQQRVIDQAGVAQTPTRSTVASGSTITLTNGTSHLLYDQAATIASLTVTLPSASLANGQVITIATRSEITALTISGGTIYGAPTTLTAGGFCSFIYSSAANAWFRKG